MSKKTLPSSSLTALITEPVFRRDIDVQENASVNVTDHHPMLLEVEHIRVYDLDPRRHPNSEYLEIKASIQASGGLESPLVVTKRPNDTDPRYMVSAGGNTRLRILQELWQETVDARFKQTWAIFKPWHSECGTLLAHLKENDLRGNLVFIDRAHAIRNLRNLLRAELERDTLSQRALAEELQKRGYQVSQSLLVWMDYAVDVLYPVLPRTLDAGAGRPQVERLRAFHNAFQKACRAYGINDDIESVFGAVLSRNDHADLDLEQIRRDLEAEISVSADCDIGRASLTFGAALDGCELIPSVAPHEAEGDIHDMTELTGDGLDPRNDVDGAANVIVENNVVPPKEEPPSEVASALDDNSARPPIPSTPPSTLTGSPEPPTFPQPSKLHSEPESEANTDAEQMDLPGLRSQAWDIATEIAIEAGLSEPLSLPHIGFGFALRPEPGKGHIACVWWHLASVAGQHPDHAPLADHLPADWIDRVPVLNPFDLAPELYLRWSSLQWQRFFDLLETVRAIRTATGQNPWRR